MPSARKGGKSASSTKKAVSKPSKAPAKKAVPKKPAPRPAGKPAGGEKRSAASAAPEPPAPPVRSDARRHVLSLAFLRDGDEFLARLETDAGQITEMKNRSLDQLLTLVASELEDLLE